MKKTVKERILAKLIKITKKHRSFQYPAMLVAAIVIFVCAVLHHFRSNVLRYASLVMTVVFFVVSSSFSLRGVRQTAAAAVPEAAKAAQDLASVPVLDDADVLDGYEDTELDNMEDIDTFSLDEILAENNMEDGNLEEEAPGGLDEGVSDAGVFAIDDWRLVLINKQHPIPEDYTFELGTIKGSMKCDARILEDVFAMLQAAQKDGMKLVICSPYRDLNRQTVLFERKIKAYMRRGMTYMDAYKVASQAVTVPGASEHQIGLALDIVSSSYNNLTKGFGNTREGKWLAEHSCEYGFILRYPQDKEYITSIEYEPWHFRYVGREAAMVITENGMTLEEFVDSLIAGSGR